MEWLHSDFFSPNSQRTHSLQVCNSYADGGVIHTLEAAEEKREKALRNAQQQTNPLAFEGIASNVMDPLPAQWLLDQGFKRVVVGHKPTGDCPAILHSSYTGLEVVSVDTSFSHRRDMKNRDSSLKFGAFRGDAIAVVEIMGEDKHNNALVTSGVLACGTDYCNLYPVLGNSSGEQASSEVGDPCLGKKLPGGWWVKAAVPPNYHLTRGSGRLVEYDVRPIAEVQEMLTS